MAAVPYLAGGENPDASKMNALYDALDSKLGQILQFKSPLVAINARTVGGFPGELLGKCFFFTDGALPSKWAWRCPDAKVKSGSAGVDPVTGLPASGINDTIIHHYDHAMFTLAEQAGLTLGSYDEGLSIVNIANVPAGSYSSGLAPLTDVGFFDHSLAVHKYRRPDGKIFYLRENGVAHPERFYRYAVAEIILEGVTALTIPDTWDKYVCFRIHNLNYAPATVTFGDPAQGGKTVTLTALECLPVRRDRSISNGVSTFSNYRVGGVAQFGDSGRRYFFKFETGDLRHYWMFHASWVAGLTNNNQFSRDQDTPANSMVANNLCNPAILYDWIKAFKYDYNNDVVGEGKYAWFVPDIHEVKDIGPDYTQFLTSTANVNTSLGDITWHKGKVLLVKFHKTQKNPFQPAYPLVQYTEIEFKGFFTLAADWAPFGIDVTTDANGLLRFKASIAGDFANWDFMLIPYGTNLFRGANEQYQTAVDLSGSRSATLDPHWFDQQVEPVNLNQVAPQVIVRRTGTGTPNQRYWTYGDQYYDVNAQTLVTQVNGDASVVLGDILPPFNGRKTLWDPQRVGIGELLTLNFFGDNNQLTQDTPYTAYAEKRLVLTPFGLQLLFYEQVPADLFQYAGNDPSANPARFGEGWELLDGKDAEGKVVRDAFFRRKRIIKLRGHGFPWMEDGRVNTMFFSPRDGRRLMARPKFLNVNAAPDGADYTAQYPQSVQNGAKIMRRVKQSHLSNPTQSGRFWECILDDSFADIWERANDQWLMGFSEAFKFYVAAFRHDLLQNTGPRGRAVTYSLLREHYNAMAMAINQLKEGKQLDFRALRFITTWQSKSYVVGIKPLVDVNIWQGRTAHPVPYEAFDCHFANPDENTQRTFQLYRDAGIAIRTLDQVPGYLDMLSRRNVDRKISTTWVATVSNSAKDEDDNSPTLSWYVSDVDMELQPAVTYQDSAREAGTAFFYNSVTFAKLNTTYAGFEWVSFADVYAWLSQFGLPIVYDECFTPLELRFLQSSRTQHDGNFHAPHKSLRGPTAHDVQSGSRIFLGSANNLNKTFTFTSEFFHRDVEMVAFAPVATSAKAKSLAAAGKLWKCPLANGFSTKNVKYWKDSRPLRYVLQGVPNFLATGSNPNVPATIEFMVNQLIQFSPSDTFRIFGSFGNTSAYIVSKTGPYVHLEWGPAADADPADIDDHELWLQMNFRGLFPIAFRAGGGNDFTAKPNFLMVHQDFWAVSKDHFNSRVEYSWERIWNRDAELTLGTLFPPATNSGAVADMNFSRYLPLFEDVHPWIWNRNELLAQRRLAPQMEVGLNVLPIAASQGSGDYGVIYYVNFVKRYSTAAI